MLYFRYAALTHQGKIRENNEDNFYINDIWRENVSENVFRTDGEVWDGYLLASVCDGMGGQDLGEVASILAVRCLHDMYGRAEAVTDKAPSQDVGTGFHKLRTKEIFSFIKNMFIPPESVEQCRTESVKKTPPKQCYMRDGPMQYVQYANQKICEEIQRTGKNMGTTFCAVEFYKGYALAVNLGDSPIYRYSDGELQELSVEHSPVGSLVRDGLITKEEAKKHPLKHKISQYLGIFPKDMTLVPAVTDLLPLQKNDQYLICSDGLSNMLREEEICEILQENDSPKKKTRDLVQLAVDHGGKDNVTVVLVEVSESLQ